MNTVTKTALLAGCSLALIGSAMAADMTGEEIKSALYGKTVYLETTAASAGGQAGQTVIFWGADGSALYKAPDGKLMHGTSEIKGNTNCTTWKERPGVGCTRYDKQGDAITVIDATSGAVRAKITKIVAGNPENLKP